MIETEFWRNMLISLLCVFITTVILIFINISHYINDVDKIFVIIVITIFVVIFYMVNTFFLGSRERGNRSTVGH